MGSPNPKPAPLIENSNVACKSDEGFKLIQFNLDANQNGDSISIATVCLIMVATIVLLAVLKKLYSLCANCYMNNRAHFNVDVRRPNHAPVNRAEAVNMNQNNRQNDQERIPRVDNPV
jgi:hypothetical protein